MPVAPDIERFDIEPFDIEPFDIVPLFAPGSLCVVIAPPVASG